MNKKHIAFCHKLVELNFNQTQAYMAIYPKSKHSSAKVDASKLLTNPNLQEYLTLLTNQSIQDSKVTVKQVIHDTKNDSQLARISGQLSVAMKGNELLGRHLGMFTDNINHSGDMGLHGLTEEKIKELAEEAMKKKK